MKTETEKALIEAIVNIRPTVLRRLAGGLLCEVEDLIEYGAEEIYLKQVEGLARWVETVATERLATKMGLPVEISPYAKEGFPPRK